MTHKCCVSLQIKDMTHLCTHSAPSFVCPGEEPPLGEHSWSAAPQPPLFPSEGGSCDGQLTLRFDWADLLCYKQEGTRDSLPAILAEHFCFVAPRSRVGWQAPLTHM